MMTLEMMKKIEDAKARLNSFAETVVNSEASFHLDEREETMEVMCRATNSHNAAMLAVHVPICFHKAFNDGCHGKLHAVADAEKHVLKVAEDAYYVRATVNMRGELVSFA